ncbi:MAG: carboxylesterase family protein, partial [Bacteroidaceae bacterium]|nr:carboxylesterase family protein [Bacteroidaceae bacterium]
MKIFQTMVLATLALTACTSGQKPEEIENPILSIEGGQVQGVICDSTDVIVYKGVPFAAPPVGELRWKKPQPVVAWEGVLQANDFRNASVQAAHDPNDGAYGTEFFETDAPFSEDCLYLNVWTPKNAAGKAETK